MSTIRDIPELVELDAARAMVRIPPELDVPLIAARAAMHRHEPSFAGWRGSASWDWCRWCIRRQSTRGSSIRWACIGWRCCSCGSCPRRAICGGWSAGRCRTVDRGRACCTIWDIGRFAIRSKTSACPSVPQHELFANSFLLEGEIADACGRLAHQPARRGWPVVRKAAHAQGPAAGQHAFRTDRHRQNGLPAARQPARRSALRPQFRPGPAHWQLVPECRAATAWRLPRRARPRQK